MIIDYMYFTTSHNCIEEVFATGKYLSSVHYRSFYKSRVTSQESLSVPQCVDSNQGELEQAKLWTNKSLCHYFNSELRVNTFHNQMRTKAQPTQTLTHFSPLVSGCDDPSETDKVIAH